MGILLMLVGLLGLASGGLKLRGRVQATVGQSPLALPEAAVGAIALLGSGAGLSRARLIAWAVVLVGLGLTLASTWTHARQVARCLRRRETSEAKRLQAYLRSREPLE